MNIVRTINFNSSLNINPKTSKTITFNGTCCDSFALSSKDNDNFLAFKKWAHEADFTSMIQSIIKDSDNKIGEGVTGSVYKIPNEERWVIKKMEIPNGKTIFFSKPFFTPIKDISPKLNIGQPICSLDMKIDNKNTSFQILKKQKGEAYGIAYSFCKVNDPRNEQHLFSLEKLSNYPQKSYDKLVRDAIYLSKENLLIDSNPNNFLLDDETQSINFVDVSRGNNGTQFSDILYGLLDSIYGMTFTSVCNDKELLERGHKAGNTISEKYTQALINNGVKFDSEHKTKVMYSNGFLDSIVNANDANSAMQELYDRGLLENIHD